MNLPWEENPSEEIIAEGVSHILAAAFGSQLGFDERDPQTETLKRDAELYLLARCATELAAIREVLYEDKYGDGDDDKKPWE